MAPVASPLREVNSRYSGREGGERASGRVTGCGALGLWVGRWPQLRVSRLGCSEVEGFVRLWESGRGPRTGGVGGNRPELSASDWRREATLGAGVPPPAASFPDPPPGLSSSRSSSASRAAVGTAERAGLKLPAEDQFEKRERGGSVRQPRGQAAGSVSGPYFA